MTKRPSPRSAGLHWSSMTPYAGNVEDPNARISPCRLQIGQRRDRLMVIDAGYATVQNNDDGAADRGVKHGRKSAVPSSGQPG